MSAQHHLNSGKNSPFDQPEDVDTPVPAVDWAHAAARGILSDLSGRRGIGSALDDLDEDIRIELVSELAAIVRLAHANEGRP